MTRFRFNRHRASKNFQVDGNLNLKVNRHRACEPENKLTLCACSWVIGMNKRETDYTPTRFSRVRGI